MRIVVAGADCAIGRAVAGRLVGLTHHVVGVGAARPDSWPGAVEFVISDLSDTAAASNEMAFTMAGADAVVHCAGDVGALAAVVNAATSAGVGRLVLVSPLGSDPDIARNLLAESKIRVIQVRTALVLGRDVDGPMLLLGTGPVALDVDGSADRHLQVVHPHDVERVVVRAVLEPDVPEGRVDVVAGGHTTVRAIAAAVGRPVVAVPKLVARFVPHAALQTARALGEFPALDGSRLRDEWGFALAYDAAQSVQDFALACRGRVAIGGVVHPIPWRLPRVLEIPAVDAPTVDGVVPESAGIGDANGEFDTPIDPRFPAFVATNLSEALPGPFSPSSASVTVLGTRAAALVIARRLRPGGAVQREMSVRTTGVFGHRLYAGITSGHFMAQTVPLIDPDMIISGFFGHTVEGLPLFGDELPPVEPRSIGKQIRAVATFANNLLGLSAGSGADTRDYVRDVQRLEVSSENPATLDDQRLRELILLGRDHVVHGWVLASASILILTAYGVILRIICGKSVLPAAGAELVSAQSLGAVHRLATAARQEPAAAKLLTASEIDTEALAAEAPQFIEALTRELTLIGHRGPGEVEMQCPTYADDPDLLIRMVAKALAAPPRPLPAPTAVPVWARGVAAAAAGQIREREIRRDRMVRAIFLLRRLLREYGRRMVAAGELAEPDDVFYLLVDELDGPPPDVAAVVARRRTEQRKLRDLVPPEAFSGRWQPAAGPTEALRGGEMLHGIGVSGGRARGVVRVVRPETIDDLQPGEILVAKVTDVGYTPAFAYAAAVVTELGGPTSHAAIVAREFGVPCVVNARGAAARLANGTLIEVDGATGDVTVLSA
ncbi:MAG: PEP-utilizing enzyme [Mycobacterium sp.]